MPIPPRYSPCRSYANDAQKDKFQAARIVHEAPLPPVSRMETAAGETLCTGPGHFGFTIPQLRILNIHKDIIYP